MPVRDTNKWETAIAQVKREDVIIRGHKLTELMGKVSYAEMMGLILNGKLPTKGQTRVLDAMLISVMDHGISPSSTVTRLLASYGVPLQAGIAGGVLTFGDIQGGAGQQLAYKFKSIVDSIRDRGVEVTEAVLRDEAKKLVQKARENKEPIDGFGHPQHGKDPRAPILLRVAKEEGVFGIYATFVSFLEQELQAATGKPIAMNVDGATAALLLDLGFSWQAARLFIIGPRVVGLTAHYIEEVEQGNVWRHVPEAQVEYTGVKP